MSAETLEIVGDMAEKIKNNVIEDVQQFSWKLSFPRKLILVDSLSTDSISILNKNLKRVRTDFVIYAEENAVRISPHSQYIPNQDYFFWAKYAAKEICVAFQITEDNQLKAYDQKMSIRRMQHRLMVEEKKVEMKAKVEAGSKASAAKAKANKPVSQIIEETEDDDVI